ncbi:MAG TPA: HAD family hydrolase [Anaerolineales bacterium]|jgi:HAD superfamily hydrolase (TIGR01509 family)|nr:HAD family hydrolase [Anaerolineales bacterium]
MMRALIFDFDGLILDTELPDYLSWQEVYHSYGVELSLEHWCTIVGGNAESDFEPHENLESLIQRRVDREQIWVSRRKSYLEHLESQPVLPGVLSLLDEARDTGLKLAVASSSPENWVVGHLTRLGLLDYFDTIVTADDVELTKPDPALFLLAADRIGVQPNEVIVLEDSSNGVRGAKRAGMFVVVVPNEITRKTDLSMADLRVEALDTIDLETLLETAR